MLQTTGLRKIHQAALTTVKTLCAFLLMVFLLNASTGSAFGDSPATKDLKGSVQYSESRYRVGPGDVLSYQVYHQPDYTQSDILVRPDGYASFNGLGEINVGGKTVDQISEILTTQVSEMVIQPQVTVTVTHTRAGTVYLAGAVVHPGMYQLSTNEPGANVSQSQTPALRTDFRVSNILANAGGVMMNADLTQVQVTRGASGEVRTVDLWKLLKSGNAEDDLWVQSGDSIYVPGATQAAKSDEDYNTLLRSSIGPGTFPVRIIGQVTTPGIIDLAGSSPYLNSAIARAAGYKDGANRKLIAIRRFDAANNQIDTLYVDPEKQDIALRPNDIIYVSESKVYQRGRFFDQVAKVFSPFTSLAGIAFAFSYFTSSHN